MAPSTKPGLIAQACERFPPALILPLAPPSAAKDLGEKVAGKAPAFWDGNNWRLLSKWQIGCSDSYRQIADEKKANVGVLLGLPQQGCQFIAFDLDLETDDNDPEAIKTLVAKEVVQRAIISLQNFLHTPLWIRETKPGRAAILFEIEETESAGTKNVFHLSHPDYDFIGKFEILARGEQVCIAGIHPITKKPIQWYRTDAPDIKFNLPDAEGIYKYPSRNAFDSSVGIVLADLERARVSAVSKRPKAAADVSGNIVRPEDQAPPSALRLIELLERLPHNVDVDRDAYVSTMHAVVGCLRALEKLKRITSEEKAAVRKTAIEWAAKWENPYGEGTTYDAEAKKFDEDWSKTGSVVAGWQSLINTGVSLGLEELRIEETREAFAAFELDEAEEPEVFFTPVINTPVAYLDEPEEDEHLPSADNGYLPKDALDDPYRPRKRDPGTLDVPQADIMLADALEKGMKGRAIYREDMRRWLVWQGQRLNWGQPYGERVVRTWIENSLSQQVSKHFPLADKTLQSKLLSSSRIDCMEKMLRVRVGEQANISNNKYILQCPNGAYDLRTGVKLDVKQQQNCWETRTTSVSPSAGGTPIFDEIVSLVCGHDPEVINWVWHYLGYLLLGDPIGHNLLVIHGPGGNGKGALGRTIQKALGSYALEASRDLILDSAKNKHKTSLYDLKGKRYWFISEISAGEVWNEQQLKSLTGGDMIQANKMHHDYEYFAPEGSFIIALNNMPKFHKIDDAILRRFFIISARMKPAKKDPTIEKRLVETGELKHVLHRIMQHAQIVYSNNFELPQTPEAMNSETMRYFESQDMFFSWWNAECDTTNLHGTAIKIKDMKARYEMYIKRQGHMDTDEEVFGQLDSLTQAQFLGELKRHGCVIERIEGEVQALGVRFKVGPVRSAA